MKLAPILIGLESCHDQPLMVLHARPHTDSRAWTPAKGRLCPPPDIRSESSRRSGLMIATRAAYISKSYDQ